MYGLVNTIINKSQIAVYCAYSAAPEAGDTSDPWRVSLLNAGSMSTNTDIDYIRPTSTGFNLCWGGSNGGIVRPIWQTSNWVKVRQFVTTDILGAPSEPTLGYLRMWMVGLGPPAKALDEARKYDGGAKAAERGTAAVQAAMDDWDQLIRDNNFTYMKTQRVPYIDGNDSPDDDFNPLGTYDVVVDLRWRYEYVIKGSGVVTWKDKANGMTGSGGWAYDESNAVITFKWASGTKETWFTQTNTGTCQYVGESPRKLTWSKQWFG